MLRSVKATVFCVIFVLTVVSLFLFASRSRDADILQTSITLPTMNATTPTTKATTTPNATNSKAESEETKLDQDIKDFILKVGEYSDEATTDRLITYYDKTLTLGWIGEGLGSIDFQGEFLGYVRDDDYILLAIGFSDDHGKNIVKPIGIQSSWFDNQEDQSLGFPFVEIDDWSILTRHEAIWETSTEGIINRLNRVRGNPIILNFLCEMDDVSLEEAIDIFGERNRGYIDNYVNTIPLVKILVSEVAVSANEEILNQKTKFRADSGNSIPNIYSLQELMSVDISKVPLVSMISSNLW